MTAGLPDVKRTVFATTFVLATLLSAPAFSQTHYFTPQFQPPAVPEKPVTPSTEQVPLPKTVNTQVKPDAASFPALPPSDPCKPKDIVGLWRLVEVYETPEGAEKSAFVTSPMQYMLFKENLTFSRFSDGMNEEPPADIFKQMNQYNGPLLQYVVQNDMAYFYQDQKPSDTQACFIVRIPKGTFQRGQMLLMPPKGQIQGRLVKVYQHANEVWAKTHQPQHPVQPQTQR